MKVFFDYGELLFEYNFNEKTLSRAHNLALKHLNSLGLEISLNELANAHNAAIHAYLTERQSLVEWPMQKIMQELIKNLNIQNHNELTLNLANIYKLNDHDSYPKQGIPEAIKELSEHSLNIISNLPHNSPLYELGRYHLLSKFDTITFSYEAGYRKPHPQIYRFALKKANANLEDSIFLSHDKEEVHGARNIGLKSCLVSTPSQILEAVK
mgnify:CR=1 FL=1